MQDGQTSPLIPDPEGIIKLMPVDFVSLILADNRRLEQAKVFAAALNAIGEAAMTSETKPYSPYLSIQEAADFLGINRRTLRNLVSQAKRQGREFDWVLRQGRKRGFVVDREKFVAWVRKQARRPGRPREFNL